ncbi:hypothetical protein RhiirA5_394355 [Rhizophagus irregularis]|uniref:F-box domain-containing protein n=3 Tax=Rhizophagus irregularis TaxID=588596 RepID=A0A2I1DX60_9GLOM|nr:hypothetical protein RirG_174440 [Rhizophagus irregularis DAOM 197198w]PKC16436.1 hypothetical protein RhiirA5_394355 [Rhizophagus irregularis]PKC71963.1 hypothetical protein RhiirA1_438561 [Rhizophagus irregularis]PKY14461.1 hypothetical protein RhiirB3_466091 [Rhizophagus irregularis]
MAEKGMIPEIYSYCDFELITKKNQIYQDFKEIINKKKIPWSNPKLNLCSLPTEILLKILYELILLEKLNPPKTAVIFLPLVCKLFYKLSHDTVIWEQVFINDYDVDARKRRFNFCNFRKIFYRRSNLNIEKMYSSVQTLENFYLDDLSPSESVLDNILDELTCLWVLVSENDGKNLKKLTELEAPEFCCRVFNLLFADMDSSLKHLACVFISLKIISMMLAYGVKSYSSIVKTMVDKLRERILNWDPTKDAVFPMLDCHALHIYLACGARDDYKILPESLIFDARKSDKWLQWTDMVDVYSSNKILWCLRNDGYDWPFCPPNRWKGLCIDPTLTVVEKILKMDLTFTEVEIDKGDGDAFSDYLDDDEGTYQDNSLHYNLEGVLTDDMGTSYYTEGESFPVDKGRRVNFVYKDNKDDNVLVKFCGFMTAYGIIGRYWKSGETGKNAGFFWIWSY